MVRLYQRDVRDTEGIRGLGAKAVPDVLSGFEGDADAVELDVGGTFTTVPAAECVGLAVPVIRANGHGCRCIRCVCLCDRAY